MIRRIESLEGTKISLRNSHYSREILSHMQTYGTDYDFCEFYELKSKNVRIGVFACLNGSLVADIMENASVSRTCIRETSEFVKFKSPYSAVMPPEMYLKTGISGYHRIQRSFFRVEPLETSAGLVSDPDPEYVFDTAFSSRNENYGLWLTDTVRRRNKDLLRLYSYNSSVLTVRFRSGGMAYISDVATPPTDRGKGYAAQLLGKAACELKKEGYTAYLACEDNMRGYYEKLGYEKIGNDCYFKSKDRSRHEFD